MAGTASAEVAPCPVQQTLGQTSTSGNLANTASAGSNPVTPTAPMESTSAAQSPSGGQEADVESESEESDEQDSDEEEDELHTGSDKHELMPLDTETEQATGRADLTQDLATEAVTQTKLASGSVADADVSAAGETDGDETALEAPTDMLVDVEGAEGTDEDGSDADTEESDESDDTAAESASPQPDSRTAAEIELAERQREEEQRQREEREQFEQEVQSMEDSIEGLAAYKIKSKIGEGTFSTVYKALDAHHDWYDNCQWTSQQSKPPKITHKGTLEGSQVYVALKRIYVTSSPDRILNELDIMNELRDCRDVSYLITAFRTEDQVVVVMPYSRHDDFRDFYRTISIGGLKDYFRCLFNALASTHAINVIHRDVKPANFLFDPRTGHGVLCDFGLAERFDPADWRGRCHHTCPTADNPRGTVAINKNVYSVHTQPGGELDGRNGGSVKPMSGNMGPPIKAERIGIREKDPRPGVRANRAGTRGFRAPEVLLKCQDQTAALDIWSAGIIMLAFLTRRFPLFNANNDTEAFLELSTVFGRAKMSRCALLHNRVIHCTVPLERPEGFRIHEFVKRLNPRMLEAPRGHPDPRGYEEEVQMAMDLCRVCLHVDVTRRWTAEECLDHGFLRE